MKISMEYCKLCLENTLRPNTKFYKGICPACNYLSSIKNINWSQRYDVLLSLIKKYRNKKNQFDGRPHLGLPSVFKNAKVLG